MRKINTKILASSLIIAGVLFIASISFYVCTGIYGYPWKHAEIRKEAVGYMKNKYNMNVKVARSTYNYKFDYYLVKVFDINDKDKALITVEKQKYFDKDGQYLGERLEDSYCKIYWESRLQNQLREKYPEFYKLPEIEKIQMDIAYFTAPLKEGVTSDKDEKGIFIPLMPDNNCILDVDINTTEFSDEFLEELLLVIKDLSNSEVKVDLVVTGKSKEGTDDSKPKVTKLLNLHYGMLQGIDSVEDLKNEVSDF